jgi:hypothetical protein
MAGRNDIPGRTGGRFAMIVASLLCCLELTACAHPTRPMLGERTIQVSGRGIAGDRGEAGSEILTRAAKLTLDHGFRYFRIVNPPGALDERGMLLIQPGTTITIEVYRNGEIGTARPHLWDALAVAGGDLRSALGTAR